MGIRERLFGHPQITSSEVAESWAKLEVANTVTDEVLDAEIFRALPQCDLLLTILSLNVISMMVAFMPPVPDSAQPIREYMTRSYHKHLVPELLRVLWDAEESRRALAASLLVKACEGVRRSFNDWSATDDGSIATPNQDPSSDYSDARVSISDELDGLLKGLQEISHGASRLAVSRMTILARYEDLINKEVYRIIVERSRPLMEAWSSNMENHLGPGYWAAKRAVELLGADTSAQLVAIPLFHFHVTATANLYSSFLEDVCSKLRVVG